MREGNARLSARCRLLPGPASVHAAALRRTAQGGRTPGRRGHGQGTAHGIAGRPVVKKA
ncbi:hypothetical protein XCR_3137 [Xanthomonas campestris pv. raphani 756C]|nr:hypothetical protein XCR_3137 [Xanthomonas campestris pv. raphani 756C]